MRWSEAARLAVPDVKLKQKPQHCQETLNSHSHNDYAGGMEIRFAK